MIAAGLSRLLAALERLQIPYFICGSLASSVHGLPRTTMDVDLVARLSRESVEALANELAGDFYADAGMMRNALHTGRALKRISERRWNDVRGIVAVQGERLDVGYLRAWAPRLGIAALLDRALDSGKARPSTAAHRPAMPRYYSDSVILVRYPTLALNTGRQGRE